MVFASTEKSNTVLNKVNVKSGERTRWSMKFDFSTEFVKILAFDSKGGFVFRKMNFSNFSTLGYVDDVSKCFENNGTDVEVYFEAPRPASVNAATIAPGSLFEEIIKHQNAPDVEAYFWGLKEYQGKQLNQRPAFLFLHGGPHAYRHALHDPAFNILLNRGFLILMVNFSGTITYGDQFSERIHGRLGELDISEIYSIVKML